MTSWSNGNYGACGSYYFPNKCHIGTDTIAARGTPVYSLAAGTVIAQSATQDVSGNCLSSGWGYDYNISSSSPGTNTCNMALAIQYYDDDGNPFVVVLGHLIYSTTYRSGTGSVSSSVGIVTPGQVIGYIGRYYNTSGTAISADHLHFGIYSGTSSPSLWGRTDCTGANQAASSSLPSGCPTAGSSPPGDFMNTSGRNWVAPPSYPTLSSPSNGTMYANGSSVTLRWNAVSGAYRYHVMVCTSSSFTSGCLDTDGGSLIGMEPSPGATSLTFTLPSTSGVCYTYYWKVRGIAYTNYGGWSSYSSSRYIRTY